MGETQAGRVQGLAGQAIEGRQQIGRQPAIAVVHEGLLAGAIEFVAHDWMPDGGQVNPDLVLPAGFGQGLDQRVLGKAAHHPETR